MTDSGCDRPDGPGPAAARLTPQAVLEIHERWQHDVRTFLCAATRNPDLAEELLQATFSRLVESGHAARPETIRGWLLKVAHNELRLWRRREAVHARWLDAAAPAPGESLPWEALVRGEEAARVRRALATLPAEQRQVVEARIHRGQTFAAISGELGLPLGTVLTRMRLAMEKLHHALGKDT